MPEPRPYSKEPIDPEVAAASGAAKAAEPPVADTSALRK